MLEHFVYMYVGTSLGKKLCMVAVRGLAMLASTAGVLYGHVIFILTEYTYYESLLVN